MQLGECNDGSCQLKEKAMSTEGKPTITPSENGPYVVTGGLDIAGQQRAEGASSDQYTLCRCGASKNKPFCDGAHWSVEFRDDGN